MNIDKYHKTKMELIIEVQSEIYKHTTYRLQRAGVHGAHIKAIRDNPDALRYDTLLTILEKARGIE